MRRLNIIRGVSTTTRQWHDVIEIYSKQVERFAANSA